MVHDRCLKCDWFNFSRQKCDRIFKANVRVAVDGGEIRIETQPGLLPKEMENEFAAWLAGAIGDYIDAWPGWNDVKAERDNNGGCAARRENKTIKEFGRTLSLAKPLVDPQPEKNLDAHGLFKADTSLL